MDTPDEKVIISTSNVVRTGINYKDEKKNQGQYCESCKSTPCRLLSPIIRDVDSHLIPQFGIYYDTGTEVQTPVGVFKQNDTTVIPKEKILYTQCSSFSAQRN